jgi:hypothetical protein
VYAKGTTKQTYELYVGNGFKVATDLTGTRVGIASAPYTTTEIELAKADWLKNPTVTNGVLTVTLDLSGHATELSPTLPASGLCKPSSFCTFQDNTCKCNASADDYPLIMTDPTFKAECDAVCGTWAVKDLDCPDSGCFGFTVKMADDFTYFNQAPPVPLPTPDAQPTCFPQALFNVPFATPTPSSLAGDCAYSTVPTGNFCK